YNLVHFLGELGANLAVRRNDKISVDDVLAMDPDAIVISPGPCTPNEAGICLQLIALAGPLVPIFGVCLVHEAVGQAYRERGVRARSRMHGNVGELRHPGRSVFAVLTGAFLALLPLSVPIPRASLPASLEVTASADDDVIMGVMHRSHPVHGVQFHPESIASENGHQILKSFLDIAAAWNARHRVERSVA